jgi:N-acetylneuraminate synthase
LNVIQTLRDRYGCDVGYSGHETGIVISMAAAAIGISSIERHITLDRAMYGSDQAASVELVGFRRLVDGIRLIETAFGDGVKILSDGERAVREKLMPIETAMR